MSRIACILQRRAVSFLSRSRCTSSRIGFLEGAGLGTVGVLLVSGISMANSPLSTALPAKCEEYEVYEDDYDTGYTEAERFFHSLEYHRSLLPDYERRWLQTDGTLVPLKRQGEKWPRNTPRAPEIPSLELDLKFCLRGLEFQDNIQKCQDLQFKIASFCILQEDEATQRRGVKILKDLSEKGHPDGMCLYGIVLNQGITVGVDANPQQAVVWWRRSMDEHRHITATYELALANYIGDGVTENTEFAVKLFRRAAHLGHAGAAYMLGECLLEGVGTARDRGSALEWIVTAAELGHSLARARVFTILQQEYKMLDAGVALSERRLKEAEKWINTSHEEGTRTVNIERRFSIGGGSRNPDILAKRKSVIAESRDETPVCEEK